jgi:hypothetical protein
MLFRIREGWRMYCKNCGEQVIPANANYCWNCGQSLRTTAPGWGPPATPPASQPVWEKCQIVHQYTLDDIVPSLKASVTFVAEAEGPTGAYTAAKSFAFSINPSFSGPDVSPKADDNQAKAALEGVVGKLLQEGWELTGEGDRWFHRQFRRHVP